MVPAKTNDVAVAVYADHGTAEEAVKMLQRSGFDMKKIPIVGTDDDEGDDVIGFLSAADRAKIAGKIGAFWGALIGMLFGSEHIFIPVIEHVVALDPFAAIVVGALEGAIEGGVIVAAISALGGALSAVGIPKNSVLQYETVLKANKCQLVLAGDAGEIGRALEALKTSSHGSFGNHVGADEDTGAVAS